MSAIDRLPVPPAAASFLVELCAASAEADGLLGDLREEFNAIAARDGAGAARAWYWRHALGTAWHLSAGALIRRPGRFALVGVLGILASFPIAWSARWSAELLVTTMPVYYYVSANLFWLAVANGPLLASSLITTWVSGERPVGVALAILAAMLAIVGIIEPLAMTMFDPRPHRTAAFFANRAVWALVYWSLPIVIGALAGRVFSRRRRVAA
jgi:hypothetical protein